MTSPSGSPFALQATGVLQGCAVGPDRLRYVTRRLCESRLGQQGMLGGDDRGRVRLQQGLRLLLGTGARLRQSAAFCLHVGDQGAMLKLVKMLLLRCRVRVLHYRAE